MDKSYVFPKHERQRLIDGYVSVLISGICIEAGFIFKCINNPNHIFIFSTVLFIIVFALIILIPIRFIKYRFSMYAFSHDSVSVFYKDKMRTINCCDEFNVSVMEFLYAGRYSNTLAKFIVLWKKGARNPVDNISPYVAMKKYDIIILPYEQSVIEKLNSCLNTEVRFSGNTGDGSLS